jgi:hypothetical protein
VDIPRQPLGERGLRCVAELVRGPSDVGVGLPDIPRLLGKPPDDRRLAQRRGDHLDEISQLDRLGVAQVVGMMVATPLDGPDDPVDDVRDERIVAPGRAVAEHGHRLPAVDKPGELGDGQVGAIPRPVGGEEPQAGDGEPVEVVEGQGQQLAGLLGRRVGADGQVDRIGLAERGVGPVAVDA